MNSLTIPRISKTLLSFLFVASLVLTPAILRSQELSEEEKEYKAYQDIQAQKDPVQKTDMVVTFLRQKPKSKYRSYVVNEFQQALSGLQNEKKWSQIIALGEKFIAVVPNDSFTVKSMAAAYAATNNTRGFATFGEKAYASAPSGELAIGIAKAYQQLGNDAKFLQWGDKAIAGKSQDVELLADMVRKTLAQQDYARASKYSQLCLKALPGAKKPASMDARTWKSTVNASYAVSYGAIGATAYQNRRYADAIKNLDNAVKYYKGMDMAYYFLGMSYWQQNKLAPAQLNFAKAYLLRGAVSASAKKYLEQLWSSSHRGSMAGMDRLLERARQDLK